MRAGYELAEDRSAAAGSSVGATFQSDPDLAPRRRSRPCRPRTPASVAGLAQFAEAISDDFLRRSIHRRRVDDSTAGREESAHDFCAVIARDAVVTNVEGNPAAEPDDWQRFAARRDRPRQQRARLSQCAQWNEQRRRGLRRQCEQVASGAQLTAVAMPDECCIPCEPTLAMRMKRNRNDIQPPFFAETSTNCNQWLKGAFTTARRL